MQNNIQNNLISWYNHNHRQFPWREATNPYYIWISEIMLQQTTTEAVIPYYKRFIHPLSIRYGHIALPASYRS